MALLRNDPHPGVRHDALIALGNLERPSRSDDMFDDRFVTMLVDLYRTDRDSRIRTEVVKTCRLIPNNSAAIRGVLQDALVDLDGSVRAEALGAITPQVVGGQPKLSFEAARMTVVAALKDPNPGVRLGGVRALNVFGAPAREYLPILERIRDSDPDALVRSSAQLAIEAIRRSIR